MVRSGGRERQKLRTRRALVEAARELVTGGRLPSVTEVAEAALVSPATAYRYFPDQQSLLLEALVDVRPRLETVFAPLADAGTDPGERAARATETFLRLLLEREALIRAVMALSLLRSVDGSSSRQAAAALRPGFRMRWIDETLQPLNGVVEPATLGRLRLALAVVMGSEALVALQDVCGVEADEAVDVCAWAAQTLVSAVTAEHAATGA